MVTGADLVAYTQGAVDEARADTLVEGVLDSVRAYCGWHVFPERTETITVNGSGAKELQLPSLRVADVAEILEDGVPLDESAYTWSADGGVRKRVGCWPREFRSVTVTLTHGVEAAGDLALLVMEVAARAASSPMGYVREQVGGVSMAVGTVGGMAAGASFMAGDYARLDGYRVEDWSA